MGYGATRSLERVAAAMGLLESASIDFEAAQDIPQGGVLWAVPALLSVGLLRHSQPLYQLPRGFYGGGSVFLLLALMALARLESVEQLRYAAPGEWGNLLGLDRIPEVRTLRAKLRLLCAEAGRAARWNAALAQEWMGQPAAEGVFYIDGHVRVYHGGLTPLPRHYVARQRFYLRATIDYWINGLEGQPFFYINQEVDPGLVALLRKELVPWLKDHVPLSAASSSRQETEPRQPRFTVVVDREGYSPELFGELQQDQIAVLCYHRYPEQDWPEEEFQEQEVSLVGGQKVKLRLAERGTYLGRKGPWVREVRKLSEGGHQVSMVSTDFSGERGRLAGLLMGRWSQENFFKYMRQHYGLDALVEYGTEPIPDTVTVRNPDWTERNREVRKKQAERKRYRESLEQVSLDRPLSEATMAYYELEQGKRQERIENLEHELQQLQQQRKDTPRHIPIQQLPESDRFTRLKKERKHFTDTIKMISYRAETSMACTLREKLARSDDARALLRQIYHTEVDLLPDAQAKTLTVRLHHLTQAAHDEAVRYLCEELNATETIFPGTDLRLVYKLGSC